MAKKNPFTIAGLATLFFAGSEAKARKERVASKKREEERQERLKQYADLQYEELDPEHLTARTSEGITVMVTKSKSSPLWRVRAYKGESSVRSPHGFPSCSEAMDNAPIYIDRVLYPVKKKRKK